MKTDSEYLFVEIAAQRCRQLIHGAKPKLESKAHKYTTLAVQEVDSGTVPWALGEREEGSAGQDDVAENDETEEE